MKTVKVVFALVFLSISFLTTFGQQPLGSGATTSVIRLSVIDVANQTVTLQGSNIAPMVDISQWRFRSEQVELTLSTGASLTAGSYIIAPNGSATFQINAALFPNFLQNIDELALLYPSGAPTGTIELADYAQWGGVVQNSEAASAVSEGVWGNTTDVISGFSPFIYQGSLDTYDGVSNWSASQWIRLTKVDVTSQTIDIFNDSNDFINVDLSQWRLYSGQTALTI
ncbi:MAG: hypothetical protein AAF740_09500, partial [Bacteroidota bacterium]